MGAIRGNGHVVRAIAFHLEAPGDFTGSGFYRHNISKAGAGDNQQATIIGAVHVVHILIITFTNEVTHRLEKYQPQRVEQYFCHALALVRYTVNATKFGVGFSVDDVDHAFPIVSDKDDIPGVAGHRLGTGKSQDTGNDKCRRATAEFHSCHSEFSELLLLLLISANTCTFLFPALT